MSGRLGPRQRQKSGRLGPRQGPISGHLRPRQRQKGGRRTARPAMLALLVLMALGLAAACAEPTSWRKASVTGERWARDKSTCRSLAREKTEKEFRRRAGTVGSPVYGTGRTFERNMAVFDARKDERRLFENCLKGLGYAKTKAAPEKKD